MNILKVCTHPWGGATIAARRQAEALRANGEDCSFICIHEDPKGSDIYLKRKNNDIFIVIPGYVAGYSGSITSSYCNNNRTLISNTWFSFWPCVTPWDDALLEACLDYEVIHFHWIAGMLSSNIVNRLSAYNKRIVFTGHDMNYFTGGCHYNAGCHRYIDECVQCPQLLNDPLELVVNSHREKISALATANATWLFPSIWLANEFRKSQLNTGNATQVLYNCLDTKKIRPLSFVDRERIRRRFGWRPNELVLIAGASNNNELRKGFSYLETAVNNLQKSLKHSANEQTVVAIVTFGYGKPSLVPPSPFMRHIHLGTIDESRVIGVFQASDLLVLPSTEENFSNTVLESLMCGCPVLAFRVGGIPDIVEDEVNGWIVDQVSHETFSKVMAEVVQATRLREMRSSTEAWRDINATKYSYSNCAKALLNIYQDQCEVSKPSMSIYGYSLKSSSHVYKALFNQSLPNITLSNISIQESIAQEVEKSNLKETGSVWNQSPEIIIPAIFTGVDNPEHSDDLGRFRWLCKQTYYVIFKYTSDARPALCFQIPNMLWVIDVMNKAVKNLQAKTNEEKLALVHCVRNSENNEFAYLWIVPDLVSLVANKYNILSLAFNESSIPEDQDSRGLCLLYTQGTVFDLRYINPDAINAFPPNFRSSTALAIHSTNIPNPGNKATEANSVACLPNAMKTWLDIMSELNHLEGAK